MKPFVKVIPSPQPSDMEGVKEFYADTAVQPYFYGHKPPLYATLVASLIASLRPASVLEFGCNAGRNLALVRRRLSGARLVGMDLNRKAIEAGQRAFGLDLQVADETSLSKIPDSSFDITFTVSVLDHIAFPEETVGHLVRITRRFVISYEICHDQTGKIESMENAEGEVVPGYPFSYFHDYRALFAKAGCWLALDVAIPAFSGNLGEFYRLQVHCRQEEDFGKDWVQRILFRDLAKASRGERPNIFWRYASRLKQSWVARDRRA